MRKRIVAIGVAAIVSGCASNNTTNDEATIRATANKYQAAYNEHDSSAYGALWATDADAIILNSPDTVGREAILRAQEAFWKASPGTRMRLTVNRVRFVSPEVAVVDFSRHGEIQNRGTWVVVRRGDDWLIAALRVMQAAQ